MLDCCFETGSLGRGGIAAAGSLGDLDLSGCETRGLLTPRPQRTRRSERGSKCENVGKCECKNVVLKLEV